MITLKLENVQFSESEFRKYNEAGYEELRRALQLARAAADSARSVEEKKTAQTHLESVEQLWRLSLQMAKERFEHARDRASGKMGALITELRRHRATGRRRNDFVVAARHAADAFHRKDFVQVEELVGRIQRSLSAPKTHLRLVPAVHLTAKNSVFTPPGMSVVDLLERALEAERNNRIGQAYRLYLQVLERQPTNAGALQRVRSVGGRAGGSR